MLEITRGNSNAQQNLTSQSLSRFLLFSMLVLAFFAILNFNLGLQLLALVQALVLLTLPPVYSWLKKGAPHGIIKHVIGFDSLVIFAPLIFVPTAENTGIYWIFGYPMVVFFFLGTRTGFVWTMVYLLVLLSGIALSSIELLTLYHTPLQTSLALVEVVIFTAIGYFFTSDREKAEGNLREAIKQAEAANHAKSEFLSVMSHELRTPLHGIIGLQNLIAADADGLNREQRENLLLAQQSAKSLRSLVNDVLDLAKIESGNMELVQDEFALFDCIRDALVPFILSAREKSIVLSLDIQNCPATIIGDESRLRQVLLNLIGNAVKFTDHGEISVKVSHQHGSLHFAIEDNGIGISTENIETIFKPFTQVKTPSLTQQRGTGLGTSIVKRFVELMNGNVQVESTLGKGSCFTFQIPCNPSGDKRISQTINVIQDNLNIVDINDRQEQKTVNHSIKALLAEDDPVGQRIAIKQLSSAGIEVDAVDNGRSAWEMIQNNPYDLLLTDLQMPGMSGIELTQKIRKMEKDSNLPHIPIIGLSAHALDEVAKECFEAGMDHFMTKPVDPETILTAIAKNIPDRTDFNR